MHDIRSSLLLYISLWPWTSLDATRPQKQLTGPTLPPFLQTIARARSSLRQELYNEALIVHSAQGSALLKTFLAVRKKQLLNATMILCLLEMNTRIIQNSIPTTSQHIYLHHAIKHARWMHSALNNRIAWLENHIATPQPLQHKTTK